MGWGFRARLSLSQKLDYGELRTQNPKYKSGITDLSRIRVTNWKYLQAVSTKFYREVKSPQWDRTGSWATYQFEARAQSNSWRVLRGKYSSVRNVLPCKPSSIVWGEKGITQELILVSLNSEIPLRIEKINVLVGWTVVNAVWFSDVLTRKKDEDEWYDKAVEARKYEAWSCYRRSLHVESREGLAKIRQKYLLYRTSPLLHRHRKCQRWCNICVLWAASYGPQKRSKPPMKQSKNLSQFERLATEIPRRFPRIDADNKFIVPKVFCKWAYTWAVPNQEALTEAKILIKTRDIISESQWSKSLNREAILNQKSFRMCKTLGTEKTLTTALNS